MLFIVYQKSSLNLPAQKLRLKCTFCKIFPIDLKSYLVEKERTLSSLSLGSVMRGSKNYGNKMCEKVDWLQ